MNLPNAITFSRLIMTAAFVIAVSQGGAVGHGTGLALFSIAAASDWLDGWLARRMGLVTPLGKLMDPLADKILVSAAYVFLTARGLCPVWATSLIIGREFLVTGLRQIALEAGQVIAADRLGKWKTAAQLTFCITALLWLTLDGNRNDPTGGLLLNLSNPQNWLMPIALWTSVALTAISGANYLWASRNLLKAR